MSSVIDGIRQAQCLAVAVPAASCSRSGGRQRKNSGRQNGYVTTGRRDDARVHVGRTGDPLEFSKHFSTEKTEWFDYHYVEESIMIYEDMLCRFDTAAERDRQTDGGRYGQNHYINIARQHCVSQNFRWRTPRWIRLKYLVIFLPQYHMHRKRDYVVYCQSIKPIKDFVVRNGSQ